MPQGGGEGLSTKSFRVNEGIRSRQVRVIDEDGSQLGVLSIQDALAKARERQLDLIEVAPMASPPVCRIMDHGKYKYQQSKREQEAHRKQKTTEVRLVKLRPMISEHDLEVKVKTIRRLIEEGHKVRVNVIFRSREMSHPQFGERVLRGVQEGTADVVIVEKTPGIEGRMMTMMLAPKSAT
jgi:translation initiation factor IF-3